MKGLGTGVTGEGARAAGARGGGGRDEENEGMDGVGANLLRTSEELSAVWILFFR
jgi:hypothetical protein